jgi:hypothetical protein
MRPRAVTSFFAFNGAPGSRRAFSLACAHDPGVDELSLLLFGEFGLADLMRRTVEECKELTHPRTVLAAYSCRAVIAIPGWSTKQPQ